MTTTRLPRLVRTFALAIPTGALLLAVPALAAGEANTSSIGSGLAMQASQGALASPASNATTGERMRVAGKLSTIVRGAAIGSRAARSGNTSDETNNADGESGADATEPAKSQNESDQPPAGPFKVVIPGQQGEAAAPAASPPAAQSPAAAQMPDAKSQTATPATVATPAATAPKPATTTALPPSPVRTIVDRSAADPAAAKPNDRPPAAASQAAATAPPSQPLKSDDRKTESQITAAPASSAPVASNSVDSGCVAGCYAPTSAQLTAPSGRRAAGVKQTSQSAPTALTNQSGIECLAGCDGIDGVPLPRAASSLPSAGVGEQPAASPQSGSNRITIMRGNTRTKSYGVTQ